MRCRAVVGKDVPARKNPVIRSIFPYTDYLTLPVTMFESGLSPTLVGLCPGSEPSGSLSAFGPLAYQRPNCEQNGSVPRTLTHTLDPLGLGKSIFYGFKALNRTTLKICCWRQRAGSSPARGTRLRYAAAERSMPGVTRLVRRSSKSEGRRAKPGQASASYAWQARFRGHPQALS